MPEFNVGHASSSGSAVGIAEQQQSPELSANVPTRTNDGLTGGSTNERH